MRKQYVWRNIHIVETKSVLDSEPIVSMSLSGLRKLDSLRDDMTARICELKEDARKAERKDQYDSD